VSFDVSAESYERFMGRYSEPLAPLFADLAGARRGQRALDVGCGPGALTAELVRRLGWNAVTAVDPSLPFTEAVAGRLPCVDARTAAAEQLPFADAEFDVTLAQLVVHFMASPGCMWPPWTVSTARSCESTAVSWLARDRSRSAGPHGQLPATASLPRDRARLQAANRTTDIMKPR
jgi:trans-aconitate methyltransferase